MSAYFTSLRVAANSAAALASRAASETYDSARGQDTVTSQPIIIIIIINSLNQSIQYSLCLDRCIAEVATDMADPVGI